MRSVLNGLLVLLEGATHCAFLLPPDEHVIANMEIGLDVSSEESIFVGVKILGVHQADRLGIADVVLSEAEIL
jgi:hypothetical protein